MVETPLFSIIIPVLEVNHFILDFNLPALSQQTFGDFEVLLLPNELPENTRQLKQDYPWLRIIPTGEIHNPSQKRNLGAIEAKGEVLAFLDDDAYPAPDWLFQAQQILVASHKKALGGPGLLPPTAGFWEIVFNCLLKTWLGNAEMKYRVRRERPREIDDFPTMNFFVDKELFLKTGGFEPDYWPGEDSKLCESIGNLGEKILYHPAPVVYHFRRNSVRKFLHQHAQYGEHRGVFFAHGDKNSRRIHYLIPSLFFLYVVSLPFAVLLTLESSILNPPIILPFILNSSLLIPSYLLPLTLYLLLLVDAALQSFLRTKDYLVALATPMVIFLMHLTYGAYFLKGLITGRTGYARREI